MTEKAQKKGKKTKAQVEKNKKQRKKKKNKNKKKKKEEEKPQDKITAAKINVNGDKLDKACNEGDAESKQDLAKMKQLSTSTNDPSTLLKELTSKLQQQSTSEGSSNATQQSALKTTLTRLSALRNQDKSSKNQFYSVAFSRSLPSLLEELLLMQTHAQVEALVVRQAKGWSPEAEDTGQEYFYSWFLSEKIPACAVILAFAHALKRYPVLPSQVGWLLSVLQERIKPAHRTIHQKTILH